MTADEVRLHIDYTAWASRKALEAALALPPEDQTKPMGVSHGGILTTLFHIYMADRVWYKRTVEPELSMPPWDMQAVTETFVEDWQDILNRWQTWANSLTDADVGRIVQFKMLNGTTAEDSLTHVVLHVVNHGTLHRGQVVGMLRQLGVKPPVTDLVYYLRELKQASAKV